MMTDDTTQDSSRETAAAERIRDLQAVFDSIKTLLMTLTRALPDDQNASPKAILAKLSELQSAHVTLLKAEEAFHEKHGDSERADIIDSAAIGVEIGRKLDRIRDARSARQIS